MMAVSSARRLLLCAAALLLTVHATDEHKGNDDLVAQVCRNASSLSFNYDFNITRELCEAALRSDKRSAAAKYPTDLALIAIDLVQRATVDAHGKVDRCVRRQGHPMDYTAVTLQYCRLDYIAIAETAPFCRALVQQYKPGHLPGHDYGLGGDYACPTKLHTKAGDCMDHVSSDFTDKDVRKAVWSEVTEVYLQATLAEAIMYVMDPPEDQE